MKKPSAAAALVEELGVAAVVVAADHGAVADLPEAVLLEDAPHPLVVGEGRAAHLLEAKSVEGVCYEQANGLARVAPAAQVFGADLYAELATTPAEVVEGDHADGFAFGLHDKGLHARVLPAGEVGEARGGAGDGDRGAPVPGGELGVAVPGVVRLHVRLSRRPQGHGLPAQDLDLFGVYGYTPSIRGVLYYTGCESGGFERRGHFG